MPETARRREFTADHEWCTTLTVTEEAVGEVRHNARTLLAIWGAGEIEDIVLLGITELLTNVLRHTRSSRAVLRLQLTRGDVWVAVSDDDPRLPSVQPLDLQATSGRGLFLLKNMADAFGAARTPTGKKVWFQVSKARPAEAEDLNVTSNQEAGRADEKLWLGVGKDVLVEPTSGHPRSACLRHPRSNCADEPSWEARCVRNFRKELT